MGRVRRLALRAGVLVAVPYAAVVGWLRLNEAQLVFHPGRERVLRAAPADLAAERVALTTGDGVPLVAWIVPAPARDSSGLWLLAFHGNAGNLSQYGRPDYYRRLRALGLNVLALDYRGYGESGGTPTEEGLYRDADAGWRYLTERLGVAPDRIILSGHSLGSAVAIDLASRVPARALVVEGAFTSVPDRGQELYPWVPVRWIAGTRFASLEKIGRVTVPTLFLHAVDDEVIPIGHGRRLHAAAAGPSRFVELHGGHGDAYDVDSLTYFGAVRELVEGAGGLRPAGGAPRGHCEEAQPTKQSGRAWRSPPRPDRHGRSAPSR